MNYEELFKNPLFASLYILGIISIIVCIIKILFPRLFKVNKSNNEDYIIKRILDNIN